MPEGTDLQNLIAAAWAAGYEARESELICRRRSTSAHREAEIAKLTTKIVGSLKETTRSSTINDAPLVHMSAVQMN